MRRQSSRSLSRPGIIDEALSLGRQATGLDQFHAAFERLPDESELGGPLPPLAPPLPVPVRRLGSALYVERRAAREHIIKSSPVLHYTESWFETLLTPQEYLPPKILYFVIGMVSLVTWGAIRYPDPTSADDRLHTTMIGFISLLIVFRTSQAYARWWEGRSLWGSIVNSTRNLASNAAIWMGDEARYMHAIICTITFAYAVKQSLRGLKLDKAEMAGLFGDDEIALLNAVEHIPMLMIDEIRRTVRAELLDQGPRGSQLAASYNWDLIISTDLKAMVDALGGCERIAKTPMPFGYLAQLRIFILLWLISWPFALTAEYGWATIPLVSIVAFIMLKIEEMAVQIEHPFGTGANDLPIDTICVTIERNLLEILRRAEHSRLRERSSPADDSSDGGPPPAQAEPHALPEQPLFRLVPPRAQQSAANLVSPPPSSAAQAFPSPAPNARGFLAVLGVSAGTSGARRAPRSSR